MDERQQRRVVLATTIARLVPKSAMHKTLLLDTVRRKRQKLQATKTDSSQE